MGKTHRASFLPKENCRGWKLNHSWASPSLATLPSCNDDNLPAFIQNQAHEKQQPHFSQGSKLGGLQQGSLQSIVYARLFLFYISSFTQPSRSSHGYLLPTVQRHESPPLPIHHRHEAPEGWPLVCKSSSTLALVLKSPMRYKGQTNSLQHRPSCTTVYFNQMHHVVRQVQWRRESISS